MAQKIVLAELDIDIDKVTKASGEYLKQMNALKNANKELDKSTSSGAEAFAKNEAQIANLSKAYRDNRKFAAALLATNSDLEELMRSENKSSLELLDSRRQLQEIQKNITGNTKEEVTLRDTLNDAIDEQTEAMREQSSEFVASKDGIGEYAQEIEKTIGSNTLLGKSISTIKDGLNVVKPIYNAYSGEIKDSISNIKNASQGTEALTKAQKAQVIVQNVVNNSLKLFKVALISTGIGAIVVALGSLVAFLSTTQKGIDAVTQVTKPLEVIFSKLFGVIQNVGQGIFDAFSKPQETIKKIGNIIKEQLVNRFEAVVSIMKRIAKFRFDGIGEDFSKAATGVENFGDKASNAFSNVKKFISESLVQGKQLADLSIQIENSENNLILKRAELNNLIKEQNKIAEDTTRSAKEREQSAINSINASKQLLGLEQGILDLKIQQKTIQNSLNDTTRADQKELNELIAERTGKETEALELQTTQVNKLNTIRREIASTRKAEAEAELAKFKEDALEKLETAKTEIEIYREVNAEKLELNGELNRQLIDGALAAELSIKEMKLAILDEQIASSLIKEEEATLQRLQINRAYKEREAELEAEFQEQKDEQEEERLEKEQEKREADAEREAEENEQRLALRLLKADDEFAFRAMQLEAQKKQEIDNAKKIGAETTAIEQKYKIYSEQLEKAKSEHKVGQAVGVFNALSDLLGQESAAGKAVAVAAAVMNTFQGVTKALAEGGIAGVVTGAIVAAAGAVSIAKIIGTKAPSRQKATVKAEKGALFKIGGKRHSSGGTKFQGEDGTQFEAEKDELIGVMSRDASRHFMNFNNEFTKGKSTKGKYASGGIMSASSSITQSSFKSQQQSSTRQNVIDYDLLALKISEANASLPNPIVGVREFAEVQNQVTTIESGANV